MKRIFAIGIGLAAALGLWVLFRTDSPVRLIPASVVNGSSSNGASSPSVSSLPRIRVGAFAPDFKLKEIGGSEVQLASFRGRCPVGFAPALQEARQWLKKHHG